MGDNKLAVFYFKRKADSLLRLPVSCGNMAAEGKVHGGRSASPLFNGATGYIHGVVLFINTVNRAINGSRVNTRFNAVGINRNNLYHAIGITIQLGIKTNPAVNFSQIDLLANGEVHSHCRPVPGGYRPVAGGHGACLAINSIDS